MAAVYPTPNAGFDPGTAQPLPVRPGAMAAQPLRPKGQVTAGRPLPPRAGDAPVAAAAAAPATASAVDASAASQGTVVSAAPVAAAAAAPPPASAARPTKPDARPMRLAFGAGAVAAVSALTIGMVKPDFGGASADEASTSPTSGDVPIEAPRNDRVRVRHVTDYVMLKPGEKPPRGATVISAEELLGVSDPAPSRNAERGGDQRAAGNQEPNGARQPSDAQRADRAPAPAREPAQETKPQPQPQPDPPRVETRQSGG